jgi:hypothetical protein
VFEIVRDHQELSPYVLPGAGCPTHRALCDEWDSAADGLTRFLRAFFVTNARPTHHRHPTAKCATISPDLSHPRCAHSNQDHRGPDQVVSNYSITIVEAMKGRQQAAKTMNFERIRRRIQLSPYSEIF